MSDKAKGRFMPEFLLFKKRLGGHPGVAPVIYLMIFGFLSRLQRESSDGHGIQAALIGAGAMALFWIPVLVTAWTGRRS